MRFIFNFFPRVIATLLFVGFAWTSAFAEEAGGGPLAAVFSDSRGVIAAVYNCCDGSSHKYNIVNYSVSSTVTLQEYCPAGGNNPPNPCGSPWELAPKSTYEGYWLSYRHTLKMTGTPPASGSINRVD